ncbi:MAG: hypothetical protein ABJN22_05050 [Litorimonas sp.]
MSQALFKPAIAIAIGLGFSVTAAGQTQDTDIRPNADQLTPEQIEAVFSNAEMDGAYNFGLNGKAYSFYRETHKPDGTVIYEEDGIAEPGRWFVREDALCFTYPSDLLAGGCFRVYRIENCYYFYSTARRQTATENNEPYWIARAVKRGERAGCEQAIS